MSGSAHPNMFPAGGDGVASAVAAQPVTAADMATSEASAWANPAGSLKNALNTAKTEPGAEKKGRQSRAAQVIEYLHSHGPAPSREICTAIGLHSDGGLTPFIASALKSKRILREGSLYLLPGQEIKGTEPLRAQTHKCAATEGTPQKLAAAPDAAQTVATQGGEPVPVSAAAGAAGHLLGEEKPRASMSGSPERTPDFTITKDDAMLVSWPDGAITVQRGGSFVELTSSQAKLICTLIELRR